MKRMLLFTLALVLLSAVFAGNAIWAANPVTLNIATAGDTNMEELQRLHVAPLIAQKYPYLKLNVVGTGPGDDGSRKIFDKLKAQKDAGMKTYDIDVAIVHQGIMSELLKEGLLVKYVKKTNVAKFVIGDSAKNSLGANVDGYVIPLFQSQTAIAYDSQKVKKVPQTIDELEAWIKANPNQFGYNGVKNGMSGVAMVTAYVYAKTGDYKQLSKGPYDPKLETKWTAILKQLKSLPVTYTNGNQGTLDQLNRGEIAMGPVWVDMFYSDVANGRMNPNIKLKLLGPGMPGQPMYIVIPAKAAHRADAVKFAQFLASPETQAKVIVDQYNWYPGIDPTAVLPKSSPAAKSGLFKDITPNDLNRFSQVFMLAQYKTDLLDAFENIR